MYFFPLPPLNREAMIMRICSRCKKEKTLQEFCLNKNRPLGRSNTCRSCGAISTRRWGENNLDKKRKTAFEWRQRLKEEILKHYGNGKAACVICGHSNIKALSIDHLEGRGKSHRASLGYSHGVGFYLWLRREGFPPGYQTLCMNCQWEKRN